VKKILFVFLFLAFFDVRSTYAYCEIISPKINQVAIALDISRPQLNIIVVKNESSIIPFYVLIHRYDRINDKNVVLKIKYLIYEQYYIVQIPNYKMFVEK